MGANELLNLVVSHVDSGIYLVDRNRRIKAWNTAAENIAGYRGSEIVGLCCQDNLLNHVDKNGAPLCATSCPLYNTMVDGEIRSAEVLLRHKDGHRVPVEVKTIPVYENGQIVGGMEIFSQKKQLQYDDDFVEAITDKAMSDPLTGLANRFFLETKIKYKLQEITWTGGSFLVLVADIDNFHLFNQYYTSAVGDLALRNIAGSFSNNIVGNNFVGRWNEDEFVGIFDYHANTNPYSIAEYIRVLISQSGVAFSDKYLSLTASIGMVAAQRGETVDSLIKRAEALMQQSKQKGKNCTTVFVSQYATPVGSGQ